MAVTGHGQVDWSAAERLLIRSERTTVLRTDRGGLVPQCEFSGDSSVTSIRV